MQTLIFLHARALPAKICIYRGERDQLQMSRGFLSYKAAPKIYSAVCLFNIQVNFCRDRTYCCLCDGLSQATTHRNSEYHHENVCSRWNTVQFRCSFRWTKKYPIQICADFSHLVQTSTQFIPTSSEIY